MSERIGLAKIADNSDEQTDALAGLNDGIGEGLLLA